MRSACPVMMKYIFLSWLNCMESSLITQKKKIQSESRCCAHVNDFGKSKHESEKKSGWKCLLIIFKNRISERMNDCTSVFGAAVLRRIWIVLALALTLAMALLHCVMLCTKGNDCHAFECLAVCVARVYHVFHNRAQESRFDKHIANSRQSVIFFIFSKRVYAWDMPLG